MEDDWRRTCAETLSAEIGFSLLPLSEFPEASIVYL
jgi:hypothetical protein